MRKSFSPIEDPLGCLLPLLLNSWRFGTSNYSTSAAISLNWASLISAGKLGSLLSILFAVNGLRPIDSVRLAKSLDEAFDALLSYLFSSEVLGASYGTSGLDVHPMPYSLSQS